MNRLAQGQRNLLPIKPILEKNVLAICLAFVIVVGYKTDLVRFRGFIFLSFAIPLYVTLHHKEPFCVALNLIIIAVVVQRLRSPGI